MKSKSGFTIVELLIVIVVIAILAVISVVAYNGIQNRAYNATVQNDLATFAKKLELYKADNDTYPASIDSAITSKDLYKISVSKDAYTTTDITFNFIYCSKSPYSEYAVLGMSKSGARLYVLNGKIGEYTGSNTWRANAGVRNICSTVLAGSGHAGLVGYNVQSGVSNPGWRAWTGAAN